MIIHKMQEREKLGTTALKEYSREKKIELESDFVFLSNDSENLPLNWNLLRVIVHEQKSHQVSFVLNFYCVYHDSTSFEQYVKN